MEMCLGHGAGWEWVLLNSCYVLAGQDGSGRSRLQGWVREEPAV
eukprot:CAMPEP_0181233344 /NCGR_PEP_ID=MMETSP1096-20121128/36280_1 /TAXON_ID=156174 ORGANISM="Chrysochromulina ericina, Strain CCMP281" /NCGR_SAMPLE_ID=MMETSP1096 /ASSEMBLY_ACC=CAM_ASM_000453 /LENGTH=43 /DNA_ID= /DNA_START= /DNA_END= /DNA_ORIENTATION=